MKPGEAASFPFRRHFTRFPLVLKICLLISLILVFSIALNGLLSVFNFSKSFGDLVGNQYFVIARDEKNTIESLLNLGLSLGEMEGVEKDLKAMAASNPDIVDVRVVDDSGETIIGADPKVGRPPGAKRIRPESPAAELSEIFSDRRAIAVALPLINSFDRQVGIIVLRYSRSMIDNSVSEVVRALTFYGFLVILAASLIGTGALRFLMRGLIDRLHRLSGALETLFETGKAASERENSKDELESACGGFELAYSSAMGEIERAWENRGRSTEEAGMGEVAGAKRGEGE
jgi:hypothetical protein